MTVSDAFSPLVFSGFNVHFVAFRELVDQLNALVPSYFIYYFSPLAVLHTVEENLGRVPFINVSIHIFSEKKSC